MRALFRLTGAVSRSPHVDEWMKARPGELGAIARTWIAKLRASGPEVEELIHDGCPTFCVQRAAFAYVNAFKAHVNVGFYQGAELPDPARLLVGEGKYMRHVKLHPGVAVDETALAALVAAAYADVSKRLTHLTLTQTAP